MYLISKIIMCFSILTLGSNVAFSKPSDRSIAVSIVKKYIQKLNTQPESEVFASIKNKPTDENSKFSIIVYDFSGLIKSWSFIPSYEGKNVSLITDYQGNPLLLDVIKSAKSSPTGWTDFKTMRVTTGQVENIKEYYEVFNDYIVSCGYFE